MHERCSSQLPRAFCWTRFGTEAGEPIEQILARKERERIASGGIFYWGVGNALGPGLAALVSECPEPEVLFSPIAGSPRRSDVAPASVVRWLAGDGLFGDYINLPDGACVTSAWDPARPSAPRYALVCASTTPIELADLGELRFDALRNISSGSPVGASQVTAVVRRTEGNSGRAYRVALRARLVWPYFLRLRSPVRVGGSEGAVLVEPEALQLAV